MNMCHLRNKLRIKTWRIPLPCLPLPLAWRLSLFRNLEAQHKQNFSWSSRVNYLVQPNENTTKLLSLWVGHQSESHKITKGSGRFTTYHINQEHNVLCIIFRDTNKSRKSPSLSFCSSCDNSSDSVGISFPFSSATLRRITLAWSSRPFFSNQRTDSGMKLKGDNVNPKINEDESYWWFEITTLAR